MVEIWAGDAQSYDPLCVNIPGKALFTFVSHMTPEKHLRIYNLIWFSCPSHEIDKVGDIIPSFLTENRLR